MGHVRSRGRRAEFISDGEHKGGRQCSELDCSARVRVRGTCQAVGVRDRCVAGQYSHCWYTKKHSESIRCVQCVVVRVCSSMLYSAIQW